MIIDSIYTTLILQSKFNVNPIKSYILSADKIDI
jgi:hypothetical protein